MNSNCLSGKHLWAAWYTLSRPKFFENRAYIYTRLCMAIGCNTWEYAEELVNNNPHYDNTVS